MGNRLSGHFDLGFRPPVSSSAPTAPPGAAAGPQATGEYARPREPIVAYSPAPAPSRTGRQAILLAAVLGALVLVGLMVFWLTRAHQQAVVPSPALPIPEDTAAAPVPHPDTVVAVSPSPKSPVLWLVLGAVGAIVGVGLLALLTATLRRFENPLPWQLVCWTLLTLGILSRHLLVPGVSGAGEVRAEATSAPSAPPTAAPRSDSGTPFDVRSLLLSAALGLALFPYTMRRLNQLRPQPGLEHVALPFGLGFFLDLAQVTALHWVPKIVG
jgi:hypothetical protein